MSKRRTYIGTYTGHRGEKVGIRRTTTVASRVYTHAVIPFYTTRMISAPAPNHPHLTIRVEEPCEPWYGSVRFCTGLANAQKQLKPGWLLVEVREYP
jgi:hypothetical protein